MTAFIILLDDEVQLQDGTIGIVRYAGCLKGEKGVFYGIDVIKGDAHNNVRPISPSHPHAHPPQFSGHARQYQVLFDRQGQRDGPFLPRV